MNKYSIILCVLVSLLFSGCITNTSNSKEYCEIYYSVEIEFINTSNSYVLLPLPITAPKTTNAISRIITDLEFEKGNGSYTIENSKYGQVLNLSCSNSLILKAEKTFERFSSWDKYFNYTFVELTTTIGNASAWGFQDNYFYFYGLQNNISLFSFHAYTKRVSENNEELERYEWKVNLTSVNDGWNSYSIFI